MSIPAIDAHRAARRGRWSVDPRFVYRVALGLALLPVVFATVHSGLSGWIPVQDAAPTVFRARHALGVHPTLLGMFTDASDYAGERTYFPGPWQLYWMWLPIRLLGVVWGPLVAMGAATSFWILLGGWFVKRRLGEIAAAGTVLFAAIFNWVLSPGLLVTPVPMVMVLPAFVAFCFGAWALAAGDEGVWPAFAFVTNFLILDHLVLVILVPAIASGAVGCWAFGRVREFSRASLESRAAIRRRTTRVLVGAGAVTVVMWVPAIIQQLTQHPGNLTNLWRSGKSHPGAGVSFVDAAARWLSLFTPPRLWSRSSRTTSYLASTAPRPSATMLVAVLVLGLIATVVVGVAAFRRRDRAVVVVLALGGVASVAACFTIARAAGGVDFVYPPYVQSSWVVAMFVTFGLLYGVARMFPSTMRSRAGIPVMACAVVVALANLPPAVITSGMTRASASSIATSRRLNDAVLDEAARRGKMAVHGGNIGSYPYTASVIVALDAKGLLGCSVPIQQFEPPPLPACEGRQIGSEIKFVVGDRETVRSAMTTNTHGTWKVLESVSTLSSSEADELEELTVKVKRGLAAADSGGRAPAFSAPFRHLVNTTADLRPIRHNVADDHLLNPVDGPLTTPDGLRTFALYVDLVDQLLSTHDGQAVLDAGPPIVVGEMSWAQLKRWAMLSDEAAAGSVTVLIRREG